MKTVLVLENWPPWWAAFLYPGIFHFIPLSIKSESFIFSARLCRASGAADFVFVLALR
jgi:hypothetical protein